MSHGVKEKLEADIASTNVGDLSSPSIQVLKKPNPVSIDQNVKKEILERARQKVGANTSPQITASLEAKRATLKSTTKGSPKMQAAALQAAMKTASEKSTVLKRSSGTKTSLLSKLMTPSDPEIYVPTILDKLISGIANLIKKFERSLSQEQPLEELDLEEKKETQVKVKVKKKKKRGRKYKKTGFYNLDKDVEEIVDVTPS